jgi:hypothetical protein
MVLLSQGACGDANAIVANETWGIANATNASPIDSMNSSYNFGTPVAGLAGGFYVLCWGYDPVNMSDFNVEVDGAAVLAGPWIGDHRCTLGVECVSELSGYRMNSSNRFIVTAGYCGDANATMVPAFGTLEPASVSTNLSWMNVSFGTPLAAAPGAAYRLCWAHSPMNMSDFRVEVDGDFELTGPATSDFSCTVGSTCVVRVAGYNLQAHNKLVMGAMGECGDPAMVPLSLYIEPAVAQPNGTETVYDLGTPLFALPGVDYKLCWGWNVTDSSMAALPSFAVVVDATFEIIYGATRQLRPQKLRGRIRRDNDFVRWAPRTR